MFRGFVIHGIAIANLEANCRDLIGFIGNAVINFDTLAMVVTPPRKRLRMWAEHYYQWHLSPLPISFAAPFNSGDAFLFIGNFCITGIDKFGTAF